MFKAITLRGTTATLAWGYRTAAALSVWTVSRSLDEAKGTYAWTLAATLGPQCDRFQVRQAEARKELVFTAPRKGGHWVWPVRTVTVGERRLTATLGPPEQ
jgi:hypothetical protein